MYVGKTLFAQIMEFVPWTSFGRIVDRYGGNSGVRRLSCAEQFRVMAFAQLTWRGILYWFKTRRSTNQRKLIASFKEKVIAQNLAAQQYRSSLL